MLLSRHRLQRLQPAWPAPCISAALASPTLAATVLVAEATEAATYPTPAAETAAFAAIAAVAAIIAAPAIATAESAKASATAKSSATAFPPAAFAAA